MKCCVTISGNSGSADYSRLGESAIAAWQGRLLPLTMHTKDFWVYQGFPIRSLAF